MSDDGEMIIIDDDSPPAALANLTLSDTPDALVMTMSPKDSKAKIAELISKESLKLCKRKLLSQDEVIDVDDHGDDTPPRSFQGSENDSSDELDEVDTDDLLDEADLVPPLQGKKVNLTTAQVIYSASLSRSGRERNKKKRRGRGRLSGGSKGKGKMKRSNTNKRQPKAVVPVRPRIETYCYDPEEIQRLAKEYPDTFWQFHADTEFPMVDVINEDHPLETLNYNMSDQAPIAGMSLSPDGTILATFSSVGVVKLWDISDEFKLLRRLRDLGEENIEEFYCGQFTTDQELIVVGGKLKDRFRWSSADEDNHILPCPVKIFNIETGRQVNKLEGHAEEILCIKTVQFKEKNYYITTSQDGYIIKWHMDDDWITLLESTRMEDGITCMAFTVSFVPNTGNKLFLAACDGHLRLYDFEEALLLQTFEDMYSSYCDCGKFVKWLDAPHQDEPHAWFVSRGAEMCDVDEGVSSIPNTCTLHKLVFPTTQGGTFQLEQVKKYSHEDYHANSWLVKITSNGRYLLAPTIYGQVFVFNMSSGQLTAILKEHEDVEVRDVIFHPYRPLIFSCGDDGCVKAYTFKEDCVQAAPDSTA
ncbi:WD40-repeat-containing domain protein [Dichotomocladium elegans]|nr:WD40-repeat-containing domain protein [Dichotomocladium elegans]